MGAAQRNTQVQLSWADTSAPGHETRSAHGATTSVLALGTWGWGASMSALVGSEPL